MLLTLLGCPAWQRDQLKTVRIYQITKSTVTQVGLLGLGYEFMIGDQKLEFSLTPRAPPEAYLVQAYSA